MNDDLKIVLDVEKKRYAVLYEIWKVTKDNLGQSLHISTVEDKGIINEQERYPIITYLRNEGLITDNNLSLHLTHKGLVEIERSIKNPQNSTEHFHQIVIQYFHGTVGAVQTAPHSAADIMQNMESEKHTFDSKGSEKGWI